MSEAVLSDPASVERSCAVVAAALSDSRRQTARLVSGDRRYFGLSSGRTTVHVPYPVLAHDWTLRSLTCGAALQCAPSKDRLAAYPLERLSSRQASALTLVEGAVAIGWISARCPGLMSEIRRLIPEPILPELDTKHGALDGSTMLDCAQALARSKHPLDRPALLGRLPRGAAVAGGLRSTLQKLNAQMPWSAKQPLSREMHAVPVGGQGGAQNPNLPPPSRPEDDEFSSSPEQRAGIPYPEWSMWKEAFLPNHVAVLERKLEAQGGHATSSSAELRRWFEQPTQRVLRGRLEDGSDLDVDQYVMYSIDRRSGTDGAARIFRDLVPEARDVTTAILLDGSSSLGGHGGGSFKLELACADALSQALTAARERHGLFVFSGDTRHRVDVVCLKDFSDPRYVAPGQAGLTTGGYTRLGAPIRHLTSRLLEQPSERRLLIAIGDGMMSDEGYEGRYAWEDTAHAVEEAVNAGVSIFYIGVGPARIDPLPEVFGPKRSTRIRHAQELPRVLASVHRELTAA